MPKPNELAILEINGRLYQDWETVWVHLTEMTPPFYEFRFTCSEGMPLSKNLAAMQIKPGDVCNVTLAGQHAILGYVSTRQAFYDGKRHYVEIRGASRMQDLAYASHISKGMEYKNKNYEEYAKEVLKPFKTMKFLTEGGQLPTHKFERISIPHGTSVLEALEMPLRSLGGIALTTNSKGDVVANVGPQGGGHMFTEGKDILEGRELIVNPGLQTTEVSPGQRPGNNKVNMSKAAHEQFSSKDFFSFVLGDLYRPGVSPMDMPAFDKKHTEGRVSTERDMMKLDEVTVWVTVQGWLEPSGKLYKQNGDYYVKSPMLIMTGSEQLRAFSVTFTQDNQKGSRTVIELVNTNAAGRRVPGENKGGGDQKTDAEKNRDALNKDFPAPTEPGGPSVP